MRSYVARVASSGLPRGALTIWTFGDGLLSWLAPFGLAASAGTALVVDLDPDSAVSGSGRSLAELVESGPSSSELIPKRNGLAFLPNGGVEPPQAAPVVAALLAGWPTVVLRSRSQRGDFAPLVPVVPLLPGMFRHRMDGPAVYQASLTGEKASGPGVTLPRPSASTVRSLALGFVPRSRWVRAWKRVWGLRWE